MDQNDQEPEILLRRLQPVEASPRARRRWQQAIKLRSASVSRTAVAAALLASVALNVALLWPDQGSPVESNQRNAIQQRPDGPPAFAMTTEVGWHGSRPNVVRTES